MKFAAFAVAEAVVLCFGACGTNTGPYKGGADLAMAGGGDDLAMPQPTDDFAMPIDFAAGGLDVQPASLQTITVVAGQTTPTVTYTATLDGQPVNAGWSVDRGDVAAISLGPSSSATLSPKGSTGGLVNVIAGINGMTVSRQVLVKLIVPSQNGATGNPAEQSQVATTVAQLTAGGGVGGVGGEGLGAQVVDTATLNALAVPSGNGQSQGLAFLYPYDKTVWPRGLPAPLVMWRWSIGDADAIQLSLTTTSGSFSWTGAFARPPILSQTGGKFIRHPIPQDVWTMATNTAGAASANGMSDQLIVSLTVASGGQAYGPISETWTVAPARLSGIIYYNSYGTQLAQNYTGAVGGNGKFGGAVLSIHVGDTSPKLAAGTNGTAANCRVCHSVAASGSSLVAQHGDVTSTSSTYTLSASGITETTMNNGAAFPAIFPDGSFALSEAGQLIPLPGGATATTPIGLAAVSTDVGSPAFAPSGTLVAFNPMAGPTANPTQKLFVMAFNSMTSTFSNPVLVVDDTGQPAETRPGWPAFFPDGKSVVFHHQSAAGADGNSLGTMNTRKGAKAQLAWTNVTDATHVTALNQLNGKDAAGNVYLPKLPAAISMSCTGDGVQVGNIDADHGDDVNLNYEPTVNPVASGGFAWVVFTSRRLYGNEATIPPFCSDPRGVDLISNITTKKLWVAAVDVSGQPGADASHPAFYLPAQELLAGNSRGFWVLDPCKPDGTTCDTGDQCCNGYCEPAADGGLVCSNTPPNGHCSQVQEKCTTAADCCDQTNLCINGFCASMQIP
ncbi:MAG TPA: hypothetical protein VFF06_31485 [Polyangia bacterium]|nr:hypothetical protein [Polyangia bacterium]